MAYFFYMLRCADHSLYCGITTDLERRLMEHNSQTKKSAKYTRAKQPVTLLYSESLPDRSTALKREHEVRHWPKEKKEELVTQTTIDQFNIAFNNHDVDAVMALMTDDCVFENTNPPPDGTRSVGQAAVRHCWEDLFRSSPNALFTVEEMIIAGTRATVRWRYDWQGKNNTPGHVRGVDVFTVKDGKVAEKLSYVKG